MSNYETKYKQQLYTIKHPTQNVTPITQRDAFRSYNIIIVQCEKVLLYANRCLQTLVILVKDNILNLMPLKSCV